MQSFLDCEQSLFGHSRLSSAGLERANSRERGKRECEASLSQGELGRRRERREGPSSSRLSPVPLSVNSLSPVLPSLGRDWPKRDCSQSKFLDSKELYWTCMTNETNQHAILAPSQHMSEKGQCKLPYARAAAAGWLITRRTLKPASSAASLEDKEKKLLLVFTTSVDSNFRAFWLAPVTWNILGYSLFCEQREKWGFVLRKFQKKKLKKRFFIHQIW